MTPGQLRRFLFFRLPLAWIMGLKLASKAGEMPKVKLPFHRLNFNPFRSMYFASQIAAAELSTGLLLWHELQDVRAYSMLVTNIEANFTKRGISDLYFICSNKEVLDQALDQLKAGEIMQIPLKSIGKDSDGNEICNVKITWSVKKRTQ